MPNSFTQVMLFEIVLGMDTFKDVSKNPQGVTLVSKDARINVAFDQEVRESLLDTDPPEGDQADAG